jgi:predicted transposase YbfD/YdcC
MSEFTILNAFAELDDSRHSQGKRHSQALCLALFVLAITAGNKGFNAMGDWLYSNYIKFCVLLKYLDCHPSGQPFRRLTASTVRRVVIDLDSAQFEKILQQFFTVELGPLQTIALDGKVLQGSYERNSEPPYDNIHSATMLVHAYWIEQQRIIDQYAVDTKTNEITALPEFIKKLALEGVVLTFDSINTIVKTKNYYIAAVKWNQQKLREQVFEVKDQDEQENKGHGRVEKRRVSICRNATEIQGWPGLKTIIKVESKREIRGECTHQTRWHISSLMENAKALIANERTQLA